MWTSMVKKWLRKNILLIFNMTLLDNFEYF